MNSYWRLRRSPLRSPTLATDDNYFEIGKGTEFADCPFTGFGALYVNRDLDAIARGEDI